jgi:hypothetical protein
LLVGEVEGQACDGRKLLMRAELVDVPSRLRGTQVPSGHVGLDLIVAAVHPHGRSVGACARGTVSVQSRGGGAEMAYPCRYICRGT